MDQGDHIARHVSLVVVFTFGGLCERVSSYFSSPRPRTSVGESAVLGNTCEEALDRAAQLSAGVPTVFAGYAILWSAFLGGCLGFALSNWNGTPTPRHTAPAADQHVDVPRTSPTSAPDPVAPPIAVSDLATYRPARLRGKLCLQSP